MYVETTELGYHRASVDLAHVTIPVGLLQLANMQTPRAVDDFLRGLATSGHSWSTAGCTGGPGALVGDRDTRIVRHDPSVDRENGLVRGAQPANLESPATRRNANAAVIFSYSVSIEWRYIVIDGISLCSTCDDILLSSKRRYTEKKVRAIVAQELVAK